MIINKTIEYFYLKYKFCFSDLLILPIHSYSKRTSMSPKLDDIILVLQNLNLSYLAIYNEKNYKNFPECDY